MKSIKRVWTTPTEIWVEDEEGNQGFAAFDDYPRLRHATPEEREEYELSDEGIHWPRIDEDLSFEGFFETKEYTSLYRFFQAHPELNASAVARRLGISQSLFAQYISGRKRPSKERTEEIQEEIQRIGESLLAVSL